MVALLPLAVLLVGVNATVDPARLFDRGRTVDAIAAASAAGRAVTGLGNFDERALQRAIAARATTTPSVLVLGSSRVMTIGSAELEGVGVPGVGVRGSGVSGATLLDVAGIYELYHRRGLVPRRVLIGVDPWMFNARGGDTRWVTLAPEASALVRRLGLPAPSARTVVRARLSRLATLVSLDYFQAAVRTLLAGPDARAGFTIATADSGAGLSRRPDGSIVYGEAVRRASQADVAASATAYAHASPMYQLGDFTRIDPVDSALFVGLVRAMREDGAAVTLLLAPYHPIVQRALAQDPRYAQVARVEALVRRVASSAGVAVCGSYDPARLGLDGTDFYDGMHARPAALARLLRACGVP